MRAIAFTLFIAGILPVIFMQPYIGLLVWSWLGYMNPYRLAYGFAYSFPWVELVAIVTLVSLVISKENKKLPGAAMTALLLGFLAWTTLTTGFAVMPHAAWERWEEFGKTLIMVFVTLMLVNSRKRVHWLVWVIAFSIAFYGIKGGVFTFLKGGHYRVYGPPKSFIADNNALALALCMVLPLLRYLQMNVKRKLAKIGFGLVMLLTGIAILGTYSRGGLLGLAVVCGMLFLKSRKKLTIVLAVVVIGFAAYHFMPGKWLARMNTLHHATRTNSGEERIHSYEFALNLALHHPILGGGFDAYESSALWAKYAPANSIERAVHSIYFRVLGDQGFPGLLLFVSLLVAMWRNCARVRKRSRDSPEEQWAFDLASMLQVSLVAYMVAGAFLPMAYFGLGYQLMAISAILDSYSREQVSRREEFARQVDNPILA